MLFTSRLALAALIASITGCASSPTAPNARIRALAPIERVDITVAESFPPQYFAAIRSVQPNACATFDGLESTRNGNAIAIQVWNLVPTNPDVACAQVIGTTEHNVALGTDFEPGQPYEVRVNDVIRTFTAQ